MRTIATLLRLGKRASGQHCPVALSTVLLMSKGQYMAPTGPDLPTMIDALQIRRQIDALPDGDVACVDPA